MFEQSVYDNFALAVKRVHKLCEKGKKDGKPDVEKIMYYVGMCAFNSEFREKFKKDTLSHAEEKMYTFKIKQNAEQQRLFEESLARAIPTEEVLVEIVEFVGDMAGLLEVNGHRGLWAQMLSFLGAPVVDILAPFRECDKEDSPLAPFRQSIQWTENPDVTGVDVFKAMQKRYNVLLLVRPKSGDETSFALDIIQNFEGGKIVYVDDESNTRIFDYLDKNSWFVKHCECQNWLNNRVYVQFYTRVTF